MTQSYRIAVLPGDGIGPEVMDATLRVVKAALDGHSGRPLELTSYEAGAEHYRRTGTALPEDVLQSCRDADAVLLAAIGLPDVRKPDGTEVQPDMMMGLRQALELYAAVRPCRLYPGVPSPLRHVTAGIDLVILRENLEGLFASFGGGCLLDDRLATDTLVVTREGTRRICEFAFRLAARRSGRPKDGRRLVTCVDKANIFRSFAFFRKVFLEVAAEHPEIDAESAYVDAASMYLVQRPQDFDVLVMENQFGDILSDLAAGIVGGLGMAPSAEVGEHHGLFQPSHGSAPDIAGQNRANPLAMILSAVMMFDWLAERHQDDSAARVGHRIESAVAAMLEQQLALPADLGGSAGTDAVADAVISQLAR